MDDKKKKKKEFIAPEGEIIEFQNEVTTLLSGILGADWGVDDDNTETF